MELILAVISTVASLKSGFVDVTVVVKSLNVPDTSAMPRWVMVKPSCECGGSLFQIPLTVVKAARATKADAKMMNFFMLFYLFIYVEKKLNS
jgi:hypothetical protein